MYLEVMITFTELKTISLKINGKIRTNENIIHTRKSVETSKEDVISRNVGSMNIDKFILASKI